MAVIRRRKKAKAIGRKVSRASGRGTERNGLEGWECGRRKGRFRKIHRIEKDHFNGRRGQAKSLAR